MRDQVWMLWAGILQYFSGWRKRGFISKQFQSRVYIHVPAPSSRNRVWSERSLSYERVPDSLSNVCRLALCCSLLLCSSNHAGVQNLYPDVLEEAGKYSGEGVQ